MTSPEPAPPRSGARLYVRADATAEGGTGHFMRCFALARHWRNAVRAPVTLIGSVPAALAARLEAERIDHVPLDRAHPEPSDLARTLALAPAGATLVLDGYQFDSAYQAALAARHRVLVVDDGGHLPAYHGYALLNQNPYAASVPYRTAPRRRLLGPAYALLGPEFQRGPAPLRNGARLLVTLGGSDPTNVTAAVLAALEHVAVGVEAVRVVVGPLNAHRAALEAACRRVPRAALVVNADMAAEIRAATLVIAAAGSTCYEIAALGRPSVVIAIAPNQMPVGESLAALGAARYAGSAEDLARDALAAMITELLGDAPERARLAARAAALVDGRGALRVAQVLLGEDID